MLQQQHNIHSHTQTTSPPICLNYIKDRKSNCNSDSLWTMFLAHQYENILTVFIYTLTDQKTTKLLDVQPSQMDVKYQRNCYQLLLCSLLHYLQLKMPCCWWITAMTNNLQFIPTQWAPSKLWLPTTTITQLQWRSKPGCFDSQQDIKLLPFAWSQDMSMFQVMKKQTQKPEELRPPII